MTDAEITDFFIRYGKALGCGDLEGIADCYATPALMVSDDESLPLPNRNEVEAAFIGGSDALLVKGLVDAKPTIDHIERITARLASVAVSWDYVDREGGLQPGDSYHYLLRLGTAPGICTVVPLTSTG